MCTAWCCCSTSCVRHTAQCCGKCAQPGVVALAVFDTQQCREMCAQPGVVVALAVFDISSVVRYVHSLVL